MTGALRRKLLFICPIMPQRSGNGLAMRAGLVLEGLARRFDVYLFVVPVSGGSLDTPDFVRELTVGVNILSLRAGLDPLAMLIDQVVDPMERQRQRFAYPRPWAARFSGLAAAQQAAAFLADVAIDAIHVMRLYLAPLAVQIRRIVKPSIRVAMLDLDDDDARVHERVAELYQLRGDINEAEFQRAEAAKYAACAAGVLDRFDLVLMSAEDDARRLAACHPNAHFESLPNAYSADPDRPRTPRVRGRDRGPVRLLFVANLGYFPNADAAEGLIGEVLPALRERGGHNIHLDIVGPGASAGMRHQAKTSVNCRIAIPGEVESVSPWYAQADVAVVPLRAGGGTRIKILEAFAYGVPVVSTQLGAEGLNTVAGKHLLLADNAADFAAACLRVVADAGLADNLAANAEQLLRLNYTPDRVHAKMDAIVDDLISQR
jgi:glycosyltransferase involved in cell wall biosynthesis